MAKESIRFSVGKGRKPSFTAEVAREFLYKSLKKARAVFSRKRSNRWAVYLYIKWKHEAGAYRIRTLVYVDETPEDAIEGLLKRIDDKILNALPASASALEEEKIIGCRFEKYVARRRKVSKTARKKRTKKKARRN